MNISPKDKAVSSMKTLYFVLVFLLSTFSCPTQGLAQENTNSPNADSQENAADDELKSGTFQADNFLIKLDDTLLSVQDSVNQTIFQRTFNHPSGYLVDLDGDGSSEFILNDYEEKQGQNYYSLYVFNTVDTFYLADSIYSGLKEPYYISSPEIKSIVLITGSPDVDSLYNPRTETVFSPLICWGIIDGELSIVNDQLYDIYIDENDKIISFIEDYFKTNGKDCAVSKELMPAIASLFINYYYAGEKASAESALRQFYACDDIEKVKLGLIKLL